MSSPIWTPDALSSECRPYAGRCWRLVEAQHVVSTLKLVDDLDDQAVLETVIEATKPPLPESCRHLDYLLATPFRYGAVYPTGSRFRRAGRTPGVYYAAERPETAVAEMAFYRLLFFAESPATPRPANATEFTAFAADVDADRALDLTLPPLDRDQALWTDLTDYRACQDLADSARAAAAILLVYLSVRDPDRGRNVALLDPAGFASPRIAERQSWRIHFGRTGASAICEHPARRLSLPILAFAADPRLSPLPAGQ